MKCLGGVNTNQGFLRSSITMLRVITMKGSQQQICTHCQAECVSQYKYQCLDGNTEIILHRWGGGAQPCDPICSIHLWDDKSQILTASAWDSWVWGLVPGINWSQIKWSSNLCLDLRTATQKYICVPATPVCNVSRWWGWNLSAQNWKFDTWW